ncbi:hypothetical protein K504DRAFT_467121, partial [Pleomassaria siparia CBS 279.74]
PIANAGISFNIAMLTDDKLRAFKKRGLRPLTNPADIKQASLVKGLGDWYAFNACDQALIKLVVVKDRRNGVSGTTLEERYAFVYNTLVEEATNCHQHLLIFRNRTPAGC